MSQPINYNERSWAIDVISDINLWASKRDTIIKRAGGEHSTRDTEGSLFPDVLLFGDDASGIVLQGWELKMPDTAIDDLELLKNAHRKATTLGLQSFVVWNVTVADLYVIEGNAHRHIKRWDDLSDIKDRAEVRPGDPRILRQLHVILEDLHGFFQNGILRSTKISESLTSEYIIDAIVSNVPLYAAALERKANQDHAFEDVVALWWASVRDEYPRQDKWTVLARSNLVSVFNKFMFTHMLKSRMAAAYSIDTLDDHAKAADGSRLFQEISSKVDFWQVFRPQIGDDALPDISWRTFLDFNKLLKQFKIETLSQEVIGDMLVALVAKSGRKMAGQVTTPPALARLLVGLTVLDHTKHVLDPCCGTGTIPRAVKELKRSKGNASALATTWASDKFSLPLQLATIGLTAPEDMGEVLRAFQADALTLRSGTEITLYDSSKGSAFQAPLPQFGYIVSNLPFVRQELRDDANLVEQINTTIRSVTGGTLGSLAAKSDLYAYVPFCLWDLLEEGGRMGIITSNSWLATGWGQRFLQLLQRFYDVEAIIASGKGRWFKNAKVVATILMLKKRSDPTTPSSFDTKYVTLRQDIEDIDADQIGELRAVLNSDAGHTSQIATVRANSPAVLAVADSLGLPPSAYFADLAWLHHVTPKVVWARDILNINRGERRGWDGFFYPPKGSGIEAEYLVPFLKTPRSIGLYGRPDGVAFCCMAGKEELKTRGHTGAVSWIESHEGMRDQHPSITRSAGLEWYMMPPDTVADLVFSVNSNDRLFVSRMQERTFVNQRLIRFTTKAEVPVDLDVMHALLNSMFSLFNLEALGFGRGEGAHDLNPTKVRDGLHVLDPSQIDEASAAAIVAAFAALKRRNILPLEEELQQADRRDFDLAVLRAFDLTHMYDDMREALLTLYRIRKAVH